MVELLKELGFEVTDTMQKIAAEQLAEFFCMQKRQY
jgi:hypothetical protein